MSTSNADGAAAAGGPDVRTLTVAHVRDSKGGGRGSADAEVMFLESARIYRVCGSNPRIAEILTALRDAARAGRALRVRFARAGGDVIEDVERA